MPRIPSAYLRCLKFNGTSNAINYRRVLLHHGISCNYAAVNQAWFAIIAMRPCNDAVMKRAEVARVIRVRVITGKGWQKNRIDRGRANYWKKLEGRIPINRRSSNCYLNRRKEFDRFSFTWSPRELIKKEEEGSLADRG